MAVVAAAGVLGLIVGLGFLLIGRADLKVGLELATPRVVVGESAVSNVEAVNEADRRALPVRLETRIGSRVEHVDVPSLAAGSSHDQLFVVPTARRSVVPVGPVRSVQGDPLGLVRRERTWTGTEHLYVHPKTTAVPSLATGWMRDLEGETTNDRSPSDVAFHTLREYVVGDDRRHIHWRTTARQADGKLMVREFVDTRRAHLGLLLSLRSDDYASVDEFELAVSVLGSLGLRAMADEQEVSCLAGGRPVPSFHSVPFLDGLAGVQASPDELSLEAIAVRGRDTLRGVSVAAVVAGSGLDAASLRAVSDRLGATVHTVLVRAAVGKESSLAMLGQSVLLDIGHLDDLPRLVFAASNR